MGLWALGPPPGGSPAQHHLSVLPTGGPLEVEPCPSLGPYPPWTWPAEVSEDREGQASARVLSLTVRCPQGRPAPEQGWYFLRPL